MREAQGLAPDASAPTTRITSVRPVDLDHPTATWAPETRAYALGRTAGNEEYAAQWSEADWRAAHEATTSIRPADLGRGEYVMDANKVVPGWLQEVVAGRLTPGGDAPAPTVCTLWIEDRNWFDLARKHADDLTVTVATPTGWPTFNTDRFYAVWDTAHDEGALPFMTIALIPHVEDNRVRFTAEIQAFYIATPASGRSVADYASRLLNLSPCARSWTTPVSDAEILDAARAVSKDAHLHADVTAWDWMCGTSGLLEPSRPAHTPA